MAEAALGVVSGGLAVASLALQLFDVAQKVHTFWESFEDAGSDVERIKENLVTLKAVAAIVANICQQEPQIQCLESVASSLLACKARTEKLTLMMRNIGTDRRAGRWEKGWTSLRATIKEKTILKLEHQLSVDLTILLFALQPFFQ
jgi:hypothetical protein